MGSQTVWYGLVSTIRNVRCSGLDVEAHEPPSHTAVSCNNDLDAQTMPFQGETELQVSEQPSVAIVPNEV